MSDVIERPLVTFALFAYNQERFIREAVEAALSQDYSPLEIILSDDCSADRTFDIMREIISRYDGPHKIVLNRNPRNLGIGGHVNRLMQLAKSGLIVVAAGDDISFPQRASVLQRLYTEGNESCKSIFSNMMIINKVGEKCGVFGSGITKERLTPEWFVENLCGVYGASQAWDKRLFEFFGPIRDGVINEDQIIPFRAALTGEVLYYEKPLVFYRRHGSNTWKDEEELQNYQEWKAARFEAAKNFSNIYQSWIYDVRKLEENPSEAVDLGLSPNLGKIELTQLKFRIEHKFNFYNDQVFLHNAKIVPKILRICSPTFREAGVNLRIRWLLFFVTPRLYFVLLKLKRLSLPKHTPRASR